MANECKPIETAPKDGCIIDLYAGLRRYADCRWYVDEDWGGEYSRWEQSLSGVPDMFFPIDGAFTHWAEIIYPL